MLGVLDLTASDGREVRSVLTQPRRLALLVHLAVTAGRGFQRRDRMLGMFWPEQDNEHARAALNRAIYYLRHELGSDVLVSRGAEELGVSAQHLWSDVAAFEAAANEGRRQDALELYQGDLLESFFISDAPDFEQWLDVERNRLRLLAGRVAREHASAEDGKGNYAVAVHWARWALERAPYEEAALQELMLLLDRTGDRAGAVHAYEQFASRLANDLELTPSPETKLLLEQIRNREQSAVPAAVRARWNREQEHAARDETPGEALLADAPSAATAVATSRPRGWRASLSRRTLLLAAAALITVLSIFARGVRSPDVDMQHVLVEPFENRTDDASLDQLGQLTSDFIATALRQTGAAYVATRGPTTSAAGDTSRRTSSSDAGFGIVISGAYYRVAGELRFAARVNIISPERVWSIPDVTVPVDSPQRALDEIRQRVTGAVAALLDPRYASWFPQANAPPTIDAFRAFARGIELQLNGQFEEALSHLQRAVATDPTFTWALMQSAVVYMNLAQSEPSDAIVDAVAARRDGLTPLQIHWLDWMLAMRKEKPLAAYLAMEKAAELAPDRFLYMQAEMARGLNRPRKTAELYERLGTDGPYDGGMADYWYNLAEAYHQYGDRRSERAAARLARRQEPNRAHALGAHIRLAAVTGELDDVNAWLDTVLSYPDENRFDFGTLATLAAEELLGHGYPEVSGAILERAIRWYREVPPEKRGAVDARFELPRALGMAGQLEEAETLAHAIVAQSNDELAVTAGLLGTIAARRRDRPTAERYIAQLESLRSVLSRPDEVATLWQARIRALLGDNDQALQLLTRTYGPQGHDLHNVADFQPLAGDPRFREFIRPKG